MRGSDVAQEAHQADDRGGCEDDQSDDDDHVQPLASVEVQYTPRNTCCQHCWPTLLVYGVANTVDRCGGTAHGGTDGWRPAHSGWRWSVIRHRHRGTGRHLACADPANRI